MWLKMLEGLDHGLALSLWLEEEVWMVPLHRNINFTSACRFIIFCGFLVLGTLIQKRTNGPSFSQSTSPIIIGSNSN